MKVHPSCIVKCLWWGKHSPISGLWHHSTSQLYYGFSKVYGMGEWNSSAYLMHRSCLGCKYYNFIKSGLIPALLISCTHKNYNAVFTKYIKIHTHRMIINPSASPRRVQMFFIWNFQHMGGVVLPLGLLALTRRLMIFHIFQLVRNFLTNIGV